MAAAIFREALVSRTEKLSPNFQRIWLTGAELKDFPVDSAGDYCKLLFDQQGAPITSHRHLAVLTEKPVLRTYTVRQFDAAIQQLIIDFVIHQGHKRIGPACHWAMHTQVNDQIVIRGPAKGKTINTAAARLLFIADMASLPALSAQLEQLPPDVSGLAVIEVMHAQDRLAIACPAGIKLHWVINPLSCRNNRLLADVVMALPWPKVTHSVWAACEFSNMRLLRNYFKDVRGIAKEALYISSYWKVDCTEEQHKAIKRADTETLGG